MTDNNDDKTISVAGKKTLTLKPSGVQQGTVRQDMGRGRTKAVVVETRKRRINRPEDERPAVTPVAPVVARPPEPTRQPVSPPPQQNRPRTGVVLNQLSAGEVESQGRRRPPPGQADADDRRHRRGRLAARPLALGHAPPPGEVQALDDAGDP